MKSILKKRGNSIPRDEPENQQHRESPFEVSLQRRRFSLPNPPSNYEVLYSVNNGLEVTEEMQDDDDEISPALSECETLFYSKSHRLELQDSYEENFTHYLPYVVRQMRASYRGTTDSSSAPEDTISDDLEINDDVSTVINESIDFNRNSSGYRILGKQTSSFNLKRQLVVASEFMKSSFYVFPSSESYSLFKQLRSKIKQDKKNSVILYDSQGNIKRLAGKLEDIETHGADIIDDRQHIVPLEYKLKGLGLPLFKVQMPYLSAFRKNAPLMIFKKYIEVPQRPQRLDFSTSQSNNEFETYNFCTVHIKNYDRIKRLTFTFTPCNQSSFKVILFLNNFRPFADFNYKNTRFRVIGTPILSAFIMNYNPHLRLLIIDENKCSMCDKIINKKPGFEFSDILKRRKSSTNTLKDTDGSLKGSSRIPSDYSIADPSTFANPYPKDSALLSSNHSRSSSSSSYLSDNLPPFGNFRDSIMYLQNLSVLPKKYAESGIVEVYQDNSSSNIGDLNSTLSVDIDSLVISCIMLTLREIGIRNCHKSPGSSLNLTNIFPLNNYGQFSLLGSVDISNNI